jgi:hypothetical protein
MQIAMVDSTTNHSFESGQETGKGQASTDAPLDGIPSKDEASKIEDQGLLISIMQGYDSFCLVTCITESSRVIGCANLAITTLHTAQGCGIPSAASV